MSKKIILVLMGFAFLFSFRLVYAEVIINEVMYNPIDGSSYEWIEIFNDGNEQINLDGWRFFNSESSSAPLRTSGSFVLEPHNYALITSNNSLVSFSGQIFTSSQFSLPNDSSKYGTYKGIYSDSNRTTGNLVIYNTELGANGDGNSLQKISGSWVTATPTPGAENEVSETVEENNNTEDNSTNSTSSSSSSKSETKETIIPIANKTKIITKTPAFAGLPVEFVINNSISNDACGKYFWNFGDGNSEEIKKTFPVPKTYPHIYYYEGEYVVTLECYKSYLSSEPDSFDKITIKVLSSEVVISKVGGAQDFFVEISNNSFSEADISGWILSSFQNKFVFPKNSILKPKNKIIVSPKTTNFSILDRDSLKLINSEGEIMSEYLSLVKPIKILTKNPIVVSSAVKIPSDGFTADFEDEQISFNNLEATAINSEVDTKNDFIYGIGLFALLGISTSAAYIIRSRNRIKKDTFGIISNDFEIIDE